jgi:Antp family, other
MTSYFTNSYMNSDMHGHYPGTGVGDFDGTQQAHHYSQAHQGHGALPYPRFPPYDRMGYYNQSMEPQGYNRPDSPSSQVGGVCGVNTPMTPQQNGAPMQAQQPPQQPIVYASCKLQAAVGGGGLGMVGENGSPPLEQMTGHHMGGQMPHHMAHAQAQVSRVYL